MTEQELKDGETYQESPEGTAAVLVFELERVTIALEAMADNNDTVDLLKPELTSIRMVTIRLLELYTGVALRGARL